MPQRQVGYNHLVSNKREWNNCFIKNRIFSFPADVLLFVGHGIMAHIQPLAAKPIKTLELHYPISQFLIIIIIIMMKIMLMMTDKGKYESS